MKSLVLGATGIIGNNIVRELLRQGHEVVAASRRITSAVNLSNLSITRLPIDVTDRSQLAQAFRGVDWVFHAAAYYPRNRFHSNLHVQRALNEVRTILDVTKNSNIQRLVYTSSLTTIGIAAQGHLADESHAYNLKDPHPYFKLKRLCEDEVRQIVQKDHLPIVVVNPTGCFGPYELKPRYLCLIPRLIQREIPVFVDHALNVVDVADVARGQILAAQKGRIGERYLLGGHNTTVEEFIRMVCQVAGSKPPRIKVPIALALGVCYASELVGLLLKKDPTLPLLGVRFTQHSQHFSLDKAVKELGYTISPMETCLIKAIQWYRKIGYC